ncbi:MAG: hypothetical protein DDG58_08510 [Ardenticatenia bacterium]|nr:MAG: hypothetical protein DDG58_08510 [Ardenticatenia bacterium]
MPRTPRRDELGFSTCVRRSLPGDRGDLDKRQRSSHPRVAATPTPSGTPPMMAERDYRKGYAMHSVKAREQWVHPYHKLGSIRATARTWCTARPVVRKWVARYQAEGAAGLLDRSRRPHTAPRRTPRSGNSGWCRRVRGRIWGLYLQPQGVPSPLPPQGQVVSINPHRSVHWSSRGGCGLPHLLPSCVSRPARGIATSSFVGQRRALSTTGKKRGMPNCQGTTNKCMCSQLACGHSQRQTK